MLNKYTTLQVILSLVERKSLWCWKSQLTSGWNWAAFRKLYFSGLQSLQFLQPDACANLESLKRACSTSYWQQIVWTKFEQNRSFLTPLYLLLVCTSNIKQDHLDTSDVIELNTTYVLTFTKKPSKVSFNSNCAKKLFPTALTSDALAVTAWQQHRQLTQSPRPWPTRAANASEGLVS